MNTPLFPMIRKRLSIEQRISLPHSGEIAFGLYASRTRKGMWFFLTVALTNEVRRDKRRIA